jgi:hypothetical protein
MDPCAPQCLVCVDIPHTRDRALIEEDGFDRCAAMRDSRQERPRRECALEGLTTDPFGEIGLQLAGLEEKPRAEPSHVAVDDIRSVV